MGNGKKRSFLLRKVIQRKIEMLLREDPWSRGALAKLRRGLGKEIGEVPELFHIFLGGLPEGFYSKGPYPSFEEQAIYTSLTLFSLHQQGKAQPMSAEGEKEDGEDRKPGNSLGAAVGLLARKKKEQEEAIKKRFDAVVTAYDFTELAHHARGIIQLLRAEDITLDYPRFAEDLYWYQFPTSKNRIRLGWGEDYYRHVQEKSKNKGEEKNG